MNEFGPKLPISQEIDKMKYRDSGESFEDASHRVAYALKDNDSHFRILSGINLDMRFLFAGRVQAAMGSPKRVTPWNCFVSREIEDSMGGIMNAASEAAETMRLGGGIGYDFSTLRPRGELIKSLGSRASGPISFMDIFNSICKTIASAGHRRGAQMGVLRCDHPDIAEFINAKHDSDTLTQFNMSVGFTDSFMFCLKAGIPFDFQWGGRIYDSVDPNHIWEMALRSTWDWAEPGVIFLDTINRKNNLWYCEIITTTNPCGEQPLPPYGACLLGSWNLVKYVKVGPDGPYFDYNQLIKDIPHVTRAMDNIIDRGIYPLEQHEQEGKNKRRMGIGVTGLANALEIMGLPYGSEEAFAKTREILKTIRDYTYRASVDLAKEKGPFPLFEPEYLESGFAKTLPDDIRANIRNHGIRNSHLLSIAPTGTISLKADNISSGIEPVFTHSYTRTIQTYDGPIFEDVTDYAYREFGVKGRTAMDISVEEHVDMLNLCSEFVDSSCSKTCNVGDEVGWERFKDVYIRAYEGGASGCTTFRPSGKRYGILNASKDEEVAESDVEEETSVGEDVGGACFFDPVTGQKECS